MAPWVQAAQDVACRAGVVVLNESDIEAGIQFGQGLLVVAFEEEAACVTKDFGFDQKDVGQVGGDEFHRVFEDAVDAVDTVGSGRVRKPCS